MRPTPAVECGVRAIDVDTLCLVSRELTTLARPRSFRHLDMELVGFREGGGWHTKASGAHLLE